MEGVIERLVPPYAQLSLSLSQVPSFMLKPQFQRLVNCECFQLRLLLLSQGRDAVPLRTALGRGSASTCDGGDRQ